MTAMFPPPRPVVMDAGWRDLLSIGDADDPFRHKVRGQQMAFLYRCLPFAILVCVSNGAVVLASMADEASPPVLFFWFFAQLAMILAWLVRAVREHLAGRLTEPTPGFVRRAAAELGVVGLAWGLLFADVLGRVPPAESMLVLAMAMTAMGVSAFTTSIFPLGAILLAGPMMAGTVWGLAASDWAGNWMVHVVMGSFLIVTIRGNMLSARSFMARRHARERLTEQEEVLRLLLNEFETNGSEWLFEFDSAGRLSIASPRFAEAVRQPVEAILGRHWTDFLTDLSAASEFFTIVRRGLPFRDTMLRVEVDGESRWWSLSGTPKRDRDGRLVGYRGVGCDVTERQRSAERITELATFDTLTGLVNRRIIHQALADGLVSVRGTCLLFVDLDRFKAVNDSLGHGAGDKLLHEVGYRLQDVVARRMGADALVGRLGGDEFAVVVRDSDLARATALGEEIIATVSRPYVLGGKQAIIGASIGLAVGPADGADVEGLMRAADLALYDVKAKGRGTVRHYDRAMHRRAEARRALELDLRNALAGGQMRLAFQPVVNALDERIVGFEALMRWRHPQHGEIPPATFIPIAEEAGLIGELGSWALAEACRIAAGWPRHIRLAVNLSPIQFDDPAFADIVSHTLSRYNIQPERLELELTESLFLEERPQTIALLEQLESMGVGFALDDFGTGYSSLGYLRKIPFRRIKIDRSFVRASTSGGGESMAIIEAIVALADRLGMETTAEGTETRAEFEAMRRLGCAQVQGYYFGAPMSADDAERLIDRTRPLVELAPALMAPVAAPVAAPVSLSATKG